MSEQNRSYLYGKFKDGEIPTGNDFKDLIDSALNLKDDGLTSYKIAVGPVLQRRFGINDTEPKGPLGIKGESNGDGQMIYFTSADESQVWNINLNPSDTDVPGFSIDDMTAGMSRIFIKPESGFVGVNTITPDEQLHVAGAAENEFVSIKISNESSEHPGFLLGHLDQTPTSATDGSFSIIEDDAGSKIPRITVLRKIEAGSNDQFNVGISETLPFATLHVTRPAIDPMSDVNLAENTGILLLGPIDAQHLALDSHQIQARTGEYVGTTLAFDATALGIQPLGGDVNIHGSFDPKFQVNIIEGKIAIGKLTPKESLDALGAITIGDSFNLSTAAPGTIRWSGSDFFGRKGDAWVSLTSTVLSDGIWTQPTPGGDLIYFNPANPKVGIGTSTPASPLQIDDNQATPATGNAISMRIVNTATSTSDAPATTRIGLQVDMSGPWGTNPASNNVGLYVKTVNGEGSNHEANVAALLNGNVVLGDTATQLKLVGSNGRNVLAIQSGDAPTTHAGTTNSGGIQIFSDEITAADGTDFSVFNVMNGDGSLIQLFAQGPITANDPNTPNTGNAITDAIIVATRKRVLDIENALRALGLLV